MKIKQEKVFKPLVITLETAEEYTAMCLIVDYYRDDTKLTSSQLNPCAQKLNRQLSDFFTNNVIGS